MAELEILKGEVPYFVLETAPLAGPAVHVCTKRNHKQRSFPGIHYEHTVRFS